MKALKYIACIPVGALVGAAAGAVASYLLFVVTLILLLIAGLLVLGDPTEWCTLWINTAGPAAIWLIRIGAGIGLIGGAPLQYYLDRKDPTAPKTLNEFCAQSIEARKRK